MFAKPGQTVIYMKLKLIIVALALTFSFSCDKNQGLNIFSVEDDIALGKQVSNEIASNPQSYPLLDTFQYAASYAYLQNIRNKILNGGELFYKDEFAWQMHIIHDDNTVNAFCTPGGYIYIYTGLLKYLASEDELAGVMAHEMAHADLRHTTEQLTKIYGVDLLVSILLGDTSNELAGIAENLVFLAFSRDDEAEADEHSVVYLCPTDYNAAGAAGFFEKLIAEGNTGNSPVFLSDHPDPGNRLEDINTKKTELGCTGTGTYDQAYHDFLLTLPL